jgi:GGDEF domain-containing protein
VPDSGFVARLGGEEFLLVLPDTGQDDAVHVCEQARQALHRHDWRPITDDLLVTGSFGIATCQRSAKTDPLALSQN